MAIVNYCLEANYINKKKNNNMSWRYTYYATLATTQNTKLISIQSNNQSTTIIYNQPNPNHPIPTNNQPQTTNTNPFINDVWIYTNSIVVETPVISSVSTYFGTSKNPEFHAKLPLFSYPPNTIKIPNKVEYSIKRHIPKKLLREIHPSVDVATELCLLFLSQLTSTYFTWKDGSNIDGWKSLKAKYVRELVHIQDNTYKKIREVLETKLWNGPILECDYVSERRIKCYNYRLGNNYIGKGICNYEIKTSEVQHLNNKNRQRQLNAAVSNSISRNLLILYSMIELPSKKEILENSKKLINAGYKTKKGKILTILNKHSKFYFKDHDNRSFVEDNLTTYEFLTDGGLMIPTIGSDASGGRIIDSISLMPGFIRNMIKIENKHVAECDFSCLHPNIAMSLYGGSERYITHQKVAEETGINLLTIKSEHLSFFNKHPKQMKKSPLFEFYSQKEPVMMKKLIKEKYESERKYKTTSQKMMRKEVEIMTDVIRECSKEGIFVGYVYDALICNPDHAQRIKEIMDEQVIKHGVFTYAKITMP